MNWKSTLASFLLFSNLQSPMRANRTTTGNREGDIIFQLDDEELVAPYLSRFDEDICKLSAEQSAFWNRDMLLLGFLLSFGLGVSSKINENGKIASAVNNRADINVKSLPSSYSNGLSTSFVNRINFSNVKTLSDLKTKAKAYWKSCGLEVNDKDDKICIFTKCPIGETVIEQCYFKPYGFFGPIFALDISEVKDLSENDKIKLLQGEFPSNCNLKVRDISKEVLESFGKHAEKFLDEIQGKTSNFYNTLQLKEYSDRKMKFGDVLYFIDKLEKAKKKDNSDLSGLEAFLWLLGSHEETDETNLLNSENVIGLFEHFAVFIPFLYPGHLLSKEWFSYYGFDLQSALTNRTGIGSMFYTGPVYRGLTMPLIDMEESMIIDVMFCDSFKSPCYCGNKNYINYVPLPVFNMLDGKICYKDNLKIPGALGYFDRKLDIKGYNILMYIVKAFDLFKSILQQWNSYLTGLYKLSDLLTNESLPKILDLSDELLKKLEDDGSDLSIALKGADVDITLLQTYRVEVRNKLNLMNKIFKRNFSDNELDNMLYEILGKKQ